MDNTPKHLEGIEGDLNKYGNTLYSVPGYSKESFDNYVSEYSDYFSQTGADPALSYAKTSLFNELGDEEYSKRGYKDYDNIDSLMNDYNRSLQPDSIVNEALIEPQIHAPESLRVSTPTHNLEQVVDLAESKTVDEIFGFKDVSLKTFYDLHPEYKNIDLGSKLSVPEISNDGTKASFTINGNVYDISSIPNTFKEEHKKKLESVDYWVSRGMTKDQAAKMFSPNNPNYDYITMLQEVSGTEELELQYIQDYPEEAVKHWISAGLDEGQAQLVMNDRAEEIKQQIQSKVTFSELPSFKKDEIIRQYEIDKYNFDNPTISEAESNYLYSSIQPGVEGGKSLQQLSNSVLDKMVNGSYYEYKVGIDGEMHPETAQVDIQKYLRMFDSIASDVSLYYADFHGMGESFMTSKDKLKLMSEFLVLSQTEGVESALEHLKNGLPQYEVPELSKGYKFLRTWGQQTASTAYSLWGIIQGTGEWIVGNSPAPEGSGWMDRWLWSIGSTDAVQRAQLMSDTGLFVGIGDTDNYRKALEMQRYGANLHDLSDSPGWQFFANQGYTAVTMLWTAGASGLVSKAASATGKVAVKSAAKLATVKGLQFAGKLTEQAATKWAGRMLAMGIMPAVTAGNEALMEGNDAYKIAVQRGNKAVEQLVNESLKADLEMDVNGNFINPEVAEFFGSRTADITSQINAITESMKSLPTEGESRQGDFEALNHLYEQLNSMYPLIAEEYKNYKYGDAIAKSKERIELEAVNAYASTVAMDAVLITTCDMFFSSVLGPQVGRMLNKIGVKGSGKLITEVSDNLADGFKVTPYNAAWKIVSNSGSEGFEELQMVVNRESATALSTANISNFFYNTTRPDAEEALGYGLFTNMSTVGAAAGNAYVSKEAWEAFGMGALGALVGSLNTNVSTVGREFDANWRASENWFEKSMSAVNAIWRNPIAYETLNRRHHINRGNSAVSYVNEMFEKNPALASSFESAKGVVSYVNDFFAAKERGGYVDAEDAEFGMFVNGANILAKLNGTKTGKAFEKYMDEILNTSADSEEGQSLIENFLSKLTDEERDKYKDDPTKALEEVKNRVKEFRRLQSQVTSTMADIDNTYGHLIDERTKEAIAFTYLAQDNMEERIKTREELIKAALTNPIFTESENSTLNDEQKKAIAEFGSIQTAQHILEVAKKNKLSPEYLKRVKNAIKVFKTIDPSNRVVLSAAEIMALSPVERASMLSKDNLKMFSKEQQDVIKAIKKAGINKDVFTAVEEAAELRSKLDANKSIIEKLEDSDLNLFKLNTTLIKNATIKNANAKTDLLKKVENYEEFKEGLDALLQSGKLTTAEEAVLGTSVFTDKKTKEFYARYTNSRSVKDSTSKLIDQMKPVSKDARNTAIIKAVLKNLAGKMTDFKDRFNFDEASNLFITGGFLNTLKEELGITWDAISKSEQDAILTELKKTIDIVNTALSNREEVFKRFNSEHPVVRIEQKPKDTTLFNDVIYNKAKAIYDVIFDKLARISNGENISLTALEMYQLASLLNKNMFVAPLDVDPILFKGIKVDITSPKSIARLYEELDRRKSIYDNDFSTYMQFIHGLSSLIGMTATGGTPLSILSEGAIEMNPSLKDKFDTRNQKETKKALSKGVKFDKRAKVVELNIIPLGDPKLTEAQQQWYEDNHIIDNVRAVNENIARKNVRIMLVKHPALFEAETTYNNDNMPLAAVVAVGKHFPGAVEIDGEYYVYVGIVEDSRKNVTDEINILNIVRESALNDYNETDPKVITYSDTGRPVEFKGLNYNYVYRDGEVVTSVKEKILSKYNHIEDPDKKLEVAYKDFCNNTVKVHTSVKMETVTEEADGETITKLVPTVYWTYTWKGKTYHKSYPSTEEDNPFEREYQQLAYIMPNPESSSEPVVNLITNHLYDLKYKDDEGNLLDLRTIYDRIMEGKMNLFEVEYANSELSFLHNCLNDLRNETFYGETGRHLRKYIKSKDDSNTKEAKAQEAVNALEKTLSGAISGYLNTKPKGATAEIQYKAKIVDGNLTVRLYNINSKDGKPLYTATISVNEFLKNSTSLEMFFQEIVFNTFYDSEAEMFREHKYNDEMIPMVKIQLNYDKYDGSDPKERQKASDKEDKRRGAFLSGVLHTDGKWASRELVSVSSNVKEDKKPTQQQQEVLQGGKKHKEQDVPPPESVETTVENAMNILNNFRHSQAALNEARSNGHSGVTTFISTEERKEKKDMSAYEVLPFELGTSLDFVVREFLRNKKDAQSTYNSIYNAYKKITTDTSKCPIQGLNWKELREYIDNVQEFINYLEDDVNGLGQTVVPFDTLFTGTLETSDGRFAKLTAIPDIITIDKRGQLHIYDMKSYRALNTTVKVPGIAEDFFVARGAYFDQSIGLKDGGILDHENGSFQKQTSSYAHIISAATGLTVASVGIVPVPLYYDLDRSNIRRSEAELAIPGLNVYQLTTSDGSQFRIKRAPSFYKDIIKLPILPIDKITSNKWVAKNSEKPEVLQGADGDFIQPTGEVAPASNIVPSVTTPKGPQITLPDSAPGVTYIDPELQKLLEECDF